VLLDSVGEALALKSEEIRGRMRAEHAVADICEKTSHASSASSTDLSFLAPAARSRASESFGLPRRLPRALAFGQIKAGKVRALALDVTWSSNGSSSAPVRHRSDHPHVLPEGL